MRSALRDATYRRLFTAQVIALAGTGLATVALGLLAYDLAGADAGRVLGTALAIKMVAYVVVAPIATAIVARMPRRRVLVSADLVRLGAAACLPFAGEVWQVYVLVFVLQAASAVFTPTFESAIPDVLPDDERYTSALSLSRLATDLEAVASPALAAALLLIVPSAALFAGTAAGFAASAAIVASLALPRRGVADPDDAPDARTFARRVTHGARLFVRTPGLRPVLAVDLADAAAGAFVLVQTVVVARAVFGLGDGAVALLLTLNGVGSMVAALALPRVLRHRTDRTVMVGGAALLAVTTLATAAVLAGAAPEADLGTASGIAALVGIGALWALSGVGGAIALTPVGRVLRRHVARDDLPDAFAAQFSLSHACWLVTYPLAGWLGSEDLALTALLLGVIAVAAAITALATWRREPALAAA